MIDVASHENLFEILTSGFKHYMRILHNKTLWFLSLFFGFILTLIKHIFTEIFPTTLVAIGFPKDIVIFIVVLVVIDTITKQCAIVKKYYGKINIKNFLKACVTNRISSKSMKIGLGVKVSFYLIFLYIAHQVSIIPEIIGRQIISNTFYSLLFLIETKSISENILECGYKNIKPLLKFLNIKEDEIIQKK